MAYEDRDEIPKYKGLSRQQDEKFGNHDVASSLNENEGQSKQPESSASDLNSSENSSSSASFVNKFSGNKSPKSKKRNIIFKRIAPTAGVGGIIGILMIFLTSSFFSGTMLQNLTANLFINWDQQFPTASIRSHKIIAKRLDGKATENKTFCPNNLAVCKKYSKPSKKFIERLDESGIKALDKKGKEIKPKAWFKGKRPQAYRIDGENIPAKKIGERLQNDPETMRNFRYAYNPKWTTWVDKTALKILGKYGLDKAPSDHDDSGDSDTDENDGNGDDDEDKDKNKNPVLADVDSKMDLEGVDGDKIKGDLNKRITAFINTSAKKATKVGKVLAVPVMACSVIKIPGVISSTVAGYQYSQYIPVFWMFTKGGDTVKAEGVNSTGESLVTPDTISNLGDALTQTYKTEDGKEIKSAMSSGAILYGITGDERNANPDNKLIPGIKNETLGKAVKLANDSNIKKACDAVSSTIVSAGSTVISVLLNTTPLGWAGTAGKVAFDVLVDSGAFTKISSIVVSGATAVLDNIVGIDTIIAKLTGVDVKNMRGEKLGDVIGIGGEKLLGSMASAGGNMPMTPQQSIAFTREVARPTKLAWAEAERLNTSPLDASNPHTALGSLVTKTLPYYTSTDTAGSKLFSFIGSSIASIPNMMLGNSVNANSAIDSQSEQWCESNFIVEASAAASSPLCVPKFGIPSKYLGLDPAAVASELHERGEINAEGEATSDGDFKDWQKTCLDLQYENINNCIIGDGEREEALFAVYTVDQRIVEGMDNEHPVPSGAGGGGDNGGPSSLPSGTAQELAQKIVDSENVTGDSRYMGQIQAVANGDNSCNINPTILGIVVAMMDEYKLNISSLNRFCTGVLTPGSGTSSSHYKEGGGHAIDINRVNGVQATGHSVQDIKFLNDVKKILPEGSGIGQSDCRANAGKTISLPDGIIQFKDSCDHNHIQVPVK